MTTPSLQLVGKLGKPLVKVGKLLENLGKLGKP